MRDRVFGIETEYAVIYHPGRRETERPRPWFVQPHRRPAHPADLLGDGARSPDQGESLFSDNDRALFAARGRFSAAGREEIRAARSGRCKAILNATGSAELYDLANDPSENVDQAAARAAEVAALRAQWETLVESSPALEVGEAMRAELDEETREHLKELGYTQD